MNVKKVAQNNVCSYCVTITMARYKNEPNATHGLVL